MKKICSKCKMEKDEKEFHKHATSKNSIRSECKKCRKEYGSTRKERDRSNSKKKELHRKDPRRYMIKSARFRAIRDNIPFNIEYDDFIVPLKCPILDIPLIVSSQCSENSPSLDRIIPDLGYVKNNVAVISVKANRLKQEMCIADIYKLINYIRSFDIEFTKI